METTIIFKDGSEITAQLNGNCFIVDEKPDFPEDLSDIRIEYEEGRTATVKNGRILECASVDSNYWFAIEEIPEAEQEKAELLEQIDMLTECILEMSEIIYAE